MNRRTSFITAAAITGTVLAGTTAVAANIGILNSAESSPIGDLSASGALDAATAPTTIEPQVVEVFIDEPSVTTTSVPTPSSTEAVDTGSTAQTYGVVDAGSVTVEVVDSGIQVGDVVANEGWEWTTDQQSPTDLTVTFTKGDATYVFVAGLADDGTITARVDEPITQIVRVTAPTTPPAPSPSVATPPTTNGVPARSDDDGEYDDDRSDDGDDHSDDRDDHDDDHDDDGSGHGGGDDDD